MNKNITLSLMLLVSAASHTVFAKDLQVFVISAQGALLETDEGKKASQEVESLNKKYQEELLKEQQELEKKAQDLKAKASTMSKESYNKTAVELENANQDLQAKAKRKSQEVQMFAQGKMEEIGKSLDKAVQNIAKQKGADLIMDETGRPLFVAEHLNVTKDVALAMNTEYKTTQVASAKDAGTAKKATA